MIGHSFIDQVTVMYLQDGNTKKRNIVLENSISVPAQESFWTENEGNVTYEPVLV